MHLCPIPAFYNTLVPSHYELENVGPNVCQLCQGIMMGRGEKTAWVTRLAKSSGVFDSYKVHPSVCYS